MADTASVGRAAERLKGKIALIVDSDLSEHQSFNAREKPIFKDFYLPENVTLIYASDAGNIDHLSTRMIKHCHDLASELYKNKDLIKTDTNLRPGIDGQYSHSRQWDLELNELQFKTKIFGRL